MPQVFCNNCILLSNTKFRLQAHTLTEVFLIPHPNFELNKQDMILTSKQTRNIRGTGAKDHEGTYAFCKFQPRLLPQLFALKLLVAKTKIWTQLAQQFLTKIIVFKLNNKNTRLCHPNKQGNIAEIGTQKKNLDKHLCDSGLVTRNSLFH